jgi:hypothetical protein
VGRGVSRKSRTVQGVSAEVGSGEAGNQGRCRESAQRWAWGKERGFFALLWDDIAEDEEGTHSKNGTVLRKTHK